MARFRDPSDRETRLIRIQLPRVQVERGGNAGKCMFTEAVTNDAEGQVAEVRAAGSRNACASPRGRGQRQLAQCSRHAMHLVRHDWRRTVSVSWTANGEQAGIVTESFLEKHIEGPLASGSDRKVGRAESPDGGTADIFEHSLRCTEILSEFFGRQ